MPRLADDDEIKRNQTSGLLPRLLLYEHATAVMQCRIKALCKMGAVFLGSINNETPPLPRMNG